MNPSGSGYLYVALSPRGALEQAVDASWERGEKTIPDMAVVGISGISLAELVGDLDPEFDEDIALRRFVPPSQLSLVKK